MTDLPPGRQAYIQARRVLKRRNTTCTPPRAGVVLQFPNKKEVTDGANVRTGEDGNLG